MIEAILGGTNRPYRISGSAENSPTVRRVKEEDVRFQCLEGLGSFSFFDLGDWSWPSEMVVQEIKSSSSVNFMCPFKEVNVRVFRDS